MTTTSVGTHIVGTLRTTSGKGSSRKLRRVNLVPAVLVGSGKESLIFSVNPKEIGRTLLSPMRRNSLFKVTLNHEDGKVAEDVYAMVKDLQVHPVKRDIRHLDFIRVDLEKPVTTSIKLILTGKSKAVVAGGKLQVVLPTIDVSCLPTNIPRDIVHDITEADFGPTHLEKLTLPAGVTLAERRKLPFMTITIRKDKEEELGATPGAGSASAPAIAAAAAGKTAAKPAAKPAAKK